MRYTILVLLLALGFSPIGSAQRRAAPDADEHVTEEADAGDEARDRAEPEERESPPEIPPACSAYWRVELKPQLRDGRVTLKPAKWIRMEADDLKGEAGGQIYARWDSRRNQFVWLTADDKDKNPIIAGSIVRGEMLGMSNDPDTLYRLDKKKGWRRVAENDETYPVLWRRLHDGSREATWLEEEPPERESESERGSGRATRDRSSDRARSERAVSGGFSAPTGLPPSQPSRPFVVQQPTARPQSDFVLRPPQTYPQGNPQTYFTQPPPTYYAPPPQPVYFYQPRQQFTFPGAGMIGGPPQGCYTRR